MKPSNIFMRAYWLAKAENNEAKQAVLSYIDKMGNDGSYRVFANEIKSHIERGK